MPDHAHFLWLGWVKESEQKAAARLFRLAWNGELERLGLSLQRQAHDHVLRESERERGAFLKVANYILENPVRAGLVQDWREFAYSGAVVPGYPNLDPREVDYWDIFWRIYGKRVEEE